MYSPNERIICEYTEREEKRMNLKKELIRIDLEDLAIFPNQEKIGQEVIQKFKNRKIINIMVTNKYFIYENN